MPEPFSLATITIEEPLGIVPLILIVPEILALPVVWFEVWLEVELLVLFCKTVNVPIVDEFAPDNLGLAEPFDEEFWTEALGIGVF